MAAAQTPGSGSLSVWWKVAAIVTMVFGFSILIGVTVDPQFGQILVLGAGVVGVCPSAGPGQTRHAHRQAKTRHESRCRMLSPLEAVRKGDWTLDS